MAETESRLSRWSRLKSKGGADPREEAQALEEKASVATARAETPDEFQNLPGGARVRRFVAAMPPLAPLAEDDDDALTRGVGHAPDAPADDGEAADAAGGDSPNAAYRDIDLEELSEEEKEIVAGLPPLDQLTAESDFQPFFKDGVPEIVKRQAMRVLWRAVPFFNMRDGLNDYDEDFNVVHKLIDQLTGNYRVGRGHLSDQELHDMMPEEARRAFDDDKDEDAEDGNQETEATGESESTTVEMSNEAENLHEKSEKTAENDQNSELFDADDIGDGEDDPAG